MGKQDFLKIELKLEQDAVERSLLNGKKFGSPNKKQCKRFKTLHKSETGLIEKISNLENRIQGLKQILGETERESKDSLRNKQDLLKKDKQLDEIKDQLNHLKQSNKENNDPSGTVLSQQQVILDVMYDMRSLKKNINLSENNVSDWKNEWKRLMTRYQINGQYWNQY